MSGTATAVLLSPPVLSFALGVAARLAGSDLRLPEALTSTLAIFLLLAIGMKGGAAMGAADPLAFASAAGAALALGCAIPLWVNLVARRFGRFPPAESASFAAHYGSTSAVTFLAAVAWLETARQSPAGFMPAVLAIMEVPAIAIALLLLPRDQGKRTLTVLHHVAASKTMVLLLGGMLIGWAAGHEGIAEVKAFFVDPFKGVLCLFLLDLGMSAADRFTEVRKHWWFLVPFGVLAPLLHGALGVALGVGIGLDAATATVLGVLAGSASYIAAPAAMRLASPQADHALPLAASIAVTFPFNLIVGIPCMHAFAMWLHG